MTTREKFVERFGEDDAKRIEDAANTHRSSPGVIGNFLDMITGGQITRADDQFLLDLSTCISWECVTRFRDDHGIVAGETDIKEWCKANVYIPDEYRDPCCARYEDYQNAETAAADPVSESRSEMVVVQAV